MQVQDIMTRDPILCPSDSNLREVAQLMVTCDCEQIPVVQRLDNAKPVGLISDRDITFRAVAQGKNPLNFKAHEIMTGPAVSVPADADVEECVRLMDRAHVQHVPVIDRNGNCCGVVSENDIARHIPEAKAAALRDASGRAAEPPPAHAPPFPEDQETLAGVDAFLEGLQHRAFPQLAGALQQQAGRISHIWNLAVRKLMPQMDRLTYAELKDSIPAMLDAIATTLHSSEPATISCLLERAPIQGLSRFHQHYDISDAMQEDRILRGVIVQQVESALGRRLTPPEAGALHSTIDVMLQQSIISLATQQKEELKAATEAQLKYLSFLSHDLNNNLNTVTLMLQVLRQELSRCPQYVKIVETLDEAQQYIQDTMAGMRRLLDHAKLHKGAVVKKIAAFDLHALARQLLNQLTPNAEKKQLRLVLDIPADLTITTDRELLSLILQNLIGNAIKYSSQGTIRIFSEAPCERNCNRAAIAVADEGPGIEPDKVNRIFQAFQRGESHGEEGVGLGLAIASDAAHIIGAHLAVESKPGEGSTFRVLLPE